jgi:hypothetical protein
MDEESTKIAVEVARDLAKEAYSDAISPAAREAGGALQAVVGLFNNVVLHPVKKANLHFRYKLEMFERDLQKKLEDVDAEKIAEPDIQIAGPTLEALKYTYDNEDLREMYLQLLASSMNTDTSGNAHPAFVDAIKSMTALDAQVFRDFPTRQTPVARVTVQFGIKVFTDALPTLYAPELIKNRDPFSVSKSIQNLCRLGLITHVEKSMTDYDYQSYKSHAFIEDRRRAFSAHPLAAGQEVIVAVDGEVLQVNDFGQAFRTVCFPKRDAKAAS